MMPFSSLVELYQYWSICDCFLSNSCAMNKMCWCLLRSTEYKHDLFRRNMQSTRDDDDMEFWCVFQRGGAWFADFVHANCFVMKFSRSGSKSLVRLWTLKGSQKLWYLCMQNLKFLIGVWLVVVRWWWVLQNNEPEHTSSNTHWHGRGLTIGLHHVLFKFGCCWYWKYCFELVCGSVLVASHAVWWLIWTCVSLVVGW